MFDLHLSIVKLVVSETSVIIFLLLLEFIYAFTFEILHFLFFVDFHQLNIQNHSIQTKLAVIKVNIVFFELISSKPYFILILSETIDELFQPTIKYLLLVNSFESILKSQIIDFLLIRYVQLIACSFQYCHIIANKLRTIVDHHLHITNWQLLFFHLFLFDYMQISTIPFSLQNIRIL